MQDELVFVGHNLPAGMRVHGVYLINDPFVNDADGSYRCPSASGSGWACSGSSCQW